MSVLPPNPRGIHAPGFAVAVIGLVGIIAVASFAARLDPSGTGSPDPLRDIVLYNVAFVVASALCWLTPATGRSQVGWRLMSGGLTLAALSNVYYSLALADRSDIPYPSLADALIMVFYVFAYSCVALQIRVRVARMQATMWLDGAIAGSGAAGLAIAVALRPVLEVTGGPWATVMTNLAYPIADLLLLALVVGAGAAFRLRLDRSMSILAAGVLVMFGANVWVLLLDSAGNYTEGVVPDLLWMLGVVLLGLSAQLSPATAPLAKEDTPHRLDWQVMALPAIFTLTSLTVLIVGWSGRLPALAGWCTVACVVTACIRTGLTFRHIRDLPEARRQARTDELTGIANRRGFYQRCDDVMTAGGGPVESALLLLDLDGFKEVNDALGHHAGDDLLVHVAQRLKPIVEPHGFFARLGGDEFAGFLPGASPAFALQVAHAIQAAFADSFTVDAVRLHVGGSIGVATSPRPAATRAELLRCADIAMYQAKTSGGVVIYTPDANNPTGERLQIIEELRRALEEGQVTVHLQPQVQLRTGLVVGVEALARWQHPTRGLLMPDAFLRHADRAGLQRALADAVMEIALRATADWWSDGMHIPVSVNLAAANITDPDLPAKVAHLLRRHGLPASALIVELTEDTLVSDPERGRAVLNQLRGIGVGISIDDYGTGYSSLSYLRDLPADELKLDRVFIDGLESDPRARAIVAHTVALAHTLDLRVVAEGVETAASAAILAELGCDMGQGFHLARPMSWEEFTVWLAAGRRAAAELHTQSA
ncbi:MAG: putative bifunctional diguanylate cyclase/phosphodiesterase [Actinomycetota bacterium]